MLNDVAITVYSCDTAPNRCTREFVSLRGSACMEYETK